MSKKNGVVSLENLGILDEIKEVFYENTGLMISYHDSVRGLFDFYPVFEKNNYCSLLQSTPKGLKKCLYSDRCALDIAKKNMEM